MTREEAIDLLDNLIGMIEDNHNSDYDTAFRMAIKALEQEPCNDAISRQAVLDLLEDTDNGWIINEVVQLPSVTPIERTGHWSHDGSHWKNRFICSECGYKLFEEQTNYCPNCGAKMVEPQESEDGE